MLKCVMKNDGIGKYNKMCIRDRGFIGFLDPPKESAKEAIDGLNNAGIRVMVLTGDNVEVLSLSLIHI